jgi:hypothetical protein
VRPLQRVARGDLVVLRHHLVQRGRDVREGLAERAEARLAGLPAPDQLRRLAEHDVVGPDRLGGGLVVAA